jgi:hypothetical protein
MEEEGITPVASVPVTSDGIEGKIEVPVEVISYINRALKSAFLFETFSILESRALHGGNITSVLMHFTDKSKDMKVFVWNVGKNNVQHFSSTESLIRFLSGFDDVRSQKVMRVAETLFKLEVVAGALSLLLLFSIVLLALLNQGHVDPVLGSALSLVIGFYFGREGQGNRH